MTAWLEVCGYFNSICENLVLTCKIRQHMTDKGGETIPKKLFDGVPEEVWAEILSLELLLPIKKSKSESQKKKTS